MKGLTEIMADNRAWVEREAAKAEAERKASLRRLKQRIANYAFEQAHNGRIVTIRHINAAIDAWAEAERKRSAP